jgi:hypothetical protein
MKTITFLRATFSILTVLSALSLSTPRAVAEIKSAPVSIKSVKGQAHCSTDGLEWVALKNGMALDHGAVIKTGPDGAVDFVLDYSSTVLRLLPDSEMALVKLSRKAAGEFVITDTTLKLASGGIVGSQRKLTRPSRFNIITPDGTAQIVGTEYLVRADGAVTVISGEVTVIYNKPKDGGSVKVSVGPGESFNPKSGDVVPTTPDYLQNIIADVDTVRNNAEVYKAGKATIVVKPTKQKNVTPTTCEDDDDDGGGGHGGDDHGNHGHPNNGHGNNGHGGHDDKGDGRN